MDDENRMCKHGEQVIYIKDILVLDLFYAGVSWQNLVISTQDKDGKVLPQKMDVLNAKREGMIETYTRVFDILFESETFDSGEESNDDVEDLLRKNIDN